jgi:hemerythrin-like metal-binding protein
MPYFKNYGSLSVGNRTIDSEHRKLIGKIEDIAHLITANNDVSLSVACKLLNDGLRDYFVVEERIAQALNFDFAQHRQAHQDLLKECQLLKNKLMNLSSLHSFFDRKDCVDSMNNYLILHIKEDSKPFKLVLDSQSYDFHPQPGE